MLLTAFWTIAVLVLSVSMVGMVGSSEALQSLEFWIIGLSAIPAVALHTRARWQFRQGEMQIPKASK
jgi:hypothetical protein